MRLEFNRFLCTHSNTLQDPRCRIELICIPKYRVALSCCIDSLRSVDRPAELAKIIAFWLLVPETMAGMPFAM